MTRHSTRASRVKVGPRIAMPWEMFSLTSSYTQDSDTTLVSDTSATFVRYKQILFPLQSTQTPKHCVELPESLS